MRSFLKLQWTVKPQAGRFFVVEETVGGGDKANGEVLIGPFDTYDEAAQVLNYRHKSMGEFFVSIRQQIELDRIQAQRALKEMREQHATVQ